MNTEPLTQLEMSDTDLAFAQRVAKRLGYEQTAYTSTSALIGLFCLKESPETRSGRRCTKCQDRPGFDGLGRPCKSCGGRGWLSYPKPRARIDGGCIVKTRELGTIFVQCLEDLNLCDMADEERQGDRKRTREPALSSS